MSDKLNKLLKDTEALLNETAKNVSDTIQDLDLPTKAHKFVDMGKDKISNIKHNIRGTELQGLSFEEHSEHIIGPMSDILTDLNIDVLDYRNNEEFLNGVRDEVLGRSVLAQALDDDSITKIHCIDWDNIWVIRNGDTVKYPFSFKSLDHYEKSVKRMLYYSGIDEEGNPEGEYFSHKVTYIYQFGKGYSMTITKTN